jgi:hypothetical protein
MWEAYREGARESGYVDPKWLSEADRRYLDKVKYPYEFRPGEDLGGL